MPKFDPANKEDIAQLSSAVGYSWGQLDIFRKNRLKLIRQYVGKNFSKNGSPQKVPLNLLELAINIYLQRLVAQNPAVDITTDVKKLKEICTRFELAGNELIEQIDLGQTLEQAVIGAIFCKGIVKVGMNLSQVEIGGVLHDTGQPFADPISLDGWVEDMTADREENSQFEGNFYYLTIDEAEELFPDHVGKFTSTDDMHEGDRDHKISEGGTGKNREEFRPTVKFLDLWLKKQELFLTCLVADDESNPIEEVLKTIKWTGPERGPYHKLGFATIENNTMPVAPAMQMKDLHELANTLFNKLGQQADRQKTITGVRAGAGKDGNRVIKTEDGDTITVDDPNNVREYKYGGIDAASLAFLLQVKDLFGYMGGNLDMLGGLGPQSDTLGQDQLLSASASMRMQKMQKKTIEFTQGILQDLMGYMWNDPVTTHTVTKRVKNFDDISVQVPFGPEDREADVLQFNIKIQPYSMQHQTPESKMQGLRTIMTEFVIPLIPMMQQQGISLDLEKMFRTIGKLANISELGDILTYAAPNHEPQQIGGSAPKPSATTRNYTRRSIPGASNAGKSAVMQQALLGGKPQQSEVASLMRPTG